MGIIPATKEKTMKKNLLVTISLVMIGCLSACTKNAPASSSASLSVERRTVDEYLISPTTKNSISLCYLNGVKDIPFLEMADLASELPKLGPSLFSSSYALTPAYEDGVYTLTRENGSSIVFDFNKKTLTYNDFDHFFSSVNAVTGIDVVSSSGFNNE